MASIMYLYCLMFTTALARSPIINGSINATKDSTVPCSKPVKTTPRSCPPNEVLKSRAACPPDTCDSIYLSYLCIANQTESLMCTCKENYLRTNSTGVCVSKNRCLPPECAHDPNAISGCGNRCKKTCADYNDTNKVCKNNVCKLFGCDCKDGYVYDDNQNKCVKPKQCTKQCSKPNERYTSCLLGECVPKTCNDVGKPIACPSVSSPCAGGCICQVGFVRNQNGDCIDQKTCPKQCSKPNERYTSCLLGECVPKTCNDVGKPIACPSVSSPCAGGCICQVGFVRNQNGDCIDQKTCPRSCNGPHEIYSSCPAGQCGPKTCDNLINPAPCPRVIPPCPGGCLCKEGYLKNSDGICIEKNKCPQAACNANQTYVSCNDKCPDKYCPGNDQPQPICDPPKNCLPGCICKINYRFDTSGKCTLASECPPVECTRQNEEFNSCPSDCLAENCEDADTPPVVCNTLLLNCQPKCVCKKGYFRNEEGLCIPARDCPSVCKNPNAQWKDCKDPCPGTCQNTKPTCLSKACTAGCQCNDGYVLSKPGGECVNIETCSEYAQCGANQTFKECTFKCPQNMCPDSDQIILCKPPRDCPGGCGCKPNYLYNTAGQCILASECPAVECSRPNEEWAPCRSEYDWERCEDKWNSPPIVPGDGDCNPRCVCIKGYYKNNNNECVAENECPEIA